MGVFGARGCVYVRVCKRVPARTLAHMSAGTCVGVGGCVDAIDGTIGSQYQLLCHTKRW
jgi:hypothetical protein